MPSHRFSLSLPTKWVLLCERSDFRRHRCVWRVPADFPAHDRTKRVFSLRQAGCQLGILCSDVVLTCVAGLRRQQARAKGEPCPVAQQFGRPAATPRRTQRAAQLSPPKNRGARWSIRWVSASRTAGFTFLNFSLSTELGAELRFRAGQRPLKPARCEAIPQTSEQFFFVGVSGSCAPSDPQHPAVR
jgi:hypothetical protein